MINPFSKERKEGDFVEGENDYCAEGKKGRRWKATSTPNDG